MSATEPTGFRRWRRTRPFWGGVFAVLGGLELVLIPLAPMSISVHQGMAGVASWLAGVLLVVAGVMMWAQPAQRSFYGILAVLLSLGSFVTSNLGGFVLGMLLGLLGGALGFAWAPRKAPAQASPPLDAQQHAGTAMKAVAALPLVLGTHMLTSPSPDPAPTPSPATAPQPKAPQPKIPQPKIPQPKESGDPKVRDGDKDGQCPKIPADTSKLSQEETRKLLRELKDAEKPADCVPQGTTRAAGGSLVYTDPGTLRARSLTMYGLSYDGVADLPSHKGTVQALKFTMDRAVLDSVDQSAGAGAEQGDMRTGRLTVRDHVIMYTTRLSASVLGIPLTFTPERPPPLTLPIMIMTSVVAEQPSVSAGSAEASGLALRA